MTGSGVQDGGSKVVKELSIEETNKIRLSLGLKPLKPAAAPATSTTAAPTNKTSNAQMPNEQTQAIQDSISKLKEKNKPMATATATTTSAGKSKGGKSYTSKHLSGIKVGNQLDSFDDGNEHILVLKDSDVLGDDEEELIDLRATEREKREKALQGNKKKSQYDKFDDNGQQSDILGHYDDKVEESGFIISSKSNTGFQDLNNNNKEDTREEVRKKMQYFSSHDLETETQLQANFYTKEELAKFKKPSADAGKKKKKMRKRGEDSLVLKELDATTSSDLGSRRSRQSTQDAEDEKDRILRETNYQKALDKASLESKLAYSADVYEEGDDEEFYKSLSSAKKAPIIEKNIVEKGMSSMSAALRLLIQKGELKPQERTKKKLLNFDDHEPIIQHKDEFGRIMNRKEAFVALSQTFHGKKSGKNKMEKRRRKYNEDLKQKHMSSTDTPLNMVKSLQTIQQSTQLPYLVLSGGNNSFISEQAPTNVQKSHQQATGRDTKKARK
eukprot:gene3498-3997_t